jgi:hypothetical protein
MGSAARNLMRFFRGDSPDSAPAQKAQERLTRRSSALAELSRVFTSDETLCVLDIGATSATNIRLFTERGHRIYSEDLLEASTDPLLKVHDEQGLPVLDSKKFLEENLAYATAQFDVVFCWNLADYMDESLVKPVQRKESVNAAGRAFTLQRVFNNRHIENLFRDFGSIKFFLSRDNIREVLVVR